MELTALRRERTSTLLFYPRTKHSPLSAEATAQATKLCAMLERLDPSPQGTLFGDWCIADVDLAFALMRLIKTNHEIPAALRTYAEAVWNRPSVREYVEHPRPPHAPPD